MNLSYYDVTVPVFKKNLLIVQTLVKKGFEHAKSKGMTEADFLNQRLAPDMFPLLNQIRIVTDNAKGAVARFTAAEPLSIEDKETTVAELMARIDTVIAFVESFTPDKFEQASEQKIIISYIPGKYQKAQDYLVDFALPNFFFHVSMVYAILREQGVEIGKMDYLGGLKLHPVE